MPLRVRRCLSAEMRTSILSCGAGLLLLMCIYLSLKPGGLDHRTAAPGYVEHFAFYVVLGGVLALAFRRMEWLRLGLLLMLLSGLLEVAQGWVPGRGPHLAEFAGSTLGAWVGISLVVWWDGRRKNISLEGRDPTGSVTITSGDGRRSV